MIISASTEPIDEEARENGSRGPQSGHGIYIPILITIHIPENGISGKAYATERGIYISTDPIAINQVFFEKIELPLEFECALINVDPEL